MEAVLRACVPLFAEAKALTLTPLTEAISRNNTNYKVLADGTAYWVRFGAASAHFLGVRRDEEQAALRAAAAAGLAPELCFASPEGLLVMPFVEGWHWTPDEAQRPENIARLAQTLRRLHALPGDTAPCSVYERIERLIDSSVPPTRVPLWASATATSGSITSLMMAPSSSAPTATPSPAIWRFCTK